jgi:hypothetical protein
MSFRTLTAALLLPLAALASPLQSDRFFTNNGGLVDHISPFLVSASNASALQDVTLDDRGQLTKRNGYDLNNTTGALTLNAVTGGAYHTATVGTSFLAVIVGTNAYRTTNSFGGSYTNVTGTVTITNSASNLAQATSLNDVVVFCNESDPPFKVGASANALALVGGAPTKAKACASFGSYLVLGNTTESAVDYPSRVRWSDVATVDSFPALNYIDVEPNDGDKIVALASFQDRVFIFKKRSIHVMLITGLPGADAFIIRPVARGIGAWAKNSVKTINNTGIVFLAQNGVYMFDGENLDFISDPIQRTFDTLSRSQWAQAVGAVYPKRNQYWLAVSSGSSSTNNEVLVYDYLQKAWTIFDIDANMLVQAEDSTGDNVLLSGDYSGNIYKQDTGTSDEPLGVSTAIMASYTTGDLLFGAPEVTKGLKYLYVFSQQDTNTTLTVDVSYDYTTVFEDTYSLDLGQAGALYDTAIYDTDVFPAINYKVSRIELNRSARSMKLKFSNSSSTGILGVIGWTVVYSSEDYR